MPPRIWVITPLEVHGVGQATLDEAVEKNLLAMLHHFVEMREDCRPPTPMPVDALLQSLQEGTNAQEEIVTVIFPHNWKGRAQLEQLHTLCRERKREIRRINLVHTAPTA